MLTHTENNFYSCHSRSLRQNNYTAGTSNDFGWIRNHLSSIQACLQPAESTDIVFKMKVISVNYAAADPTNFN